MSTVHKFSKDVSESYEFRGRTYWRPALPYPFFTTKGLSLWKRLGGEKNWRPQCVCGQIFNTLQEYEDHFRSEAESEESQQ